MPFKFKKLGVISTILKPFLFEGQTHCLSFGTYVQFAVNINHVGAHRGRAQIEFLSDALVVETINESFQNGNFALA